MNLNFFSQFRYAREVEVATHAAIQAAQAIMNVYATSFEVEYKGPNDPVTEADRAANEVIVSALQNEFAHDLVVSEESPIPELTANSSRRWYVDPLDGTRDFVAHNNEFCSMIGFSEHGQAVLGIVAIPALAAPPWFESKGFLLIGEVGLGTFLLPIVCDETELQVFPLRLDESSQLPEKTLVSSRSRRSQMVPEIRQALPIDREFVCGSVGVKVAQLLLGRANIYLHPMVSIHDESPKLWDVCAPDAIFSAANGMFRNQYGSPIDYNASTVVHNTGIFATTRPLFPEILAVLTQTLKSNPDA